MNRFRFCACLWDLYYSCVILAAAFVQVYREYLIYLMLVLLESENQQAFEILFRFCICSRFLSVYRKNLTLHLGLFYLCTYRLRAFKRSQINQLDQVSSFQACSIYFSSLLSYAQRIQIDSQFLVNQTFHSLQKYYLSSENFSN